MIPIPIEMHAPGAARWTDVMPPRRLRNHGPCWRAAVDTGWYPKFAILLATCNGEPYLAEQLDSIAAQSFPNWQVRASDDGSTDGTLGLLEAYQRKWGSGLLSLQAGPAKGFAANFLSMVCADGFSADYYAYCDQDDIWEADKLQRALEWLQTVPADVPALYCSRTRLVDVNNRAIGYSPLFKKAPCFENALVQNVGGGNTMVFNHAARSLLCTAGDHVNVVSHDWWTYLVVAGCGGVVHYDAVPSLRYRQHGDNLIGMNSTWRARLRRMRLLWQGRFRVWNDLNIRALDSLPGKLAPQSRRSLSRFLDARNCSLPSRLARFRKSGIYRQTLLGNLGLVAAAILNKI